MHRKLLPAAIKAAFTGLAIWWVLRSVDLSASWRAAQAIDPLLAMAACLMVVIQIFLGMVRWRVVTRALGLAMPFRRMCAICYSSTFFGIALPGGAGGDAVRIWMASRAGLPASRVFSSVLLERGVTILGLTLLVTATEPLLLARFPNLPAPWLFPALTAGGLIGFGVLCLLDRVPPPLRRWRLIRGLALMAADARTLLRDMRRFSLALGISILGHVNLSLAVYALAVGMALNVQITDCLVLVPPVILAATLPISIAGWGVRETAMVAAFGAIGVSSASAFVLSVLYGLVCIVTSLPGGVVWLAQNGRPMRSREEASAVSNLASGAVGR
jgi:glycosyltransferase 2 family protein